MKTRRSLISEIACVREFHFSWAVLCAKALDFFRRCDAVHQALELACLFLDVMVGGEVLLFSDW